jgi:general secretion pathway protein G
MVEQISNLKFQISNPERTRGMGLLRPSASGPAIPGIGLQASSAPCSATWGFTLLELMVVLTVLLILATMSMPIFQSAIVHAREAVLKDDLYTLRKLIDEYTLDKQHPPATLDDLVEAGYLRGGIPVDPFTSSNETWQTDVEEVPTSPSQTASGIVDVHSGSDGTALDGTAYSSW